MGSRSLLAGKLQPKAQEALGHEVTAGDKLASAINGGGLMVPEVGIRPMPPGSAKARKGTDGESLLSGGSIDKKKKKKGQVVPEQDIAMTEVEVKIEVRNRQNLKLFWFDLK